MKQTSVRYPRVSVYLDDAKLREAIKVAAARDRTTVSAYCLEAIRRRLVDDGFAPGRPATDPRRAAESLDRLRREIGPIGVSVNELIAEGRR